MTSSLLSPPFAFIIYFIIVTLISLFARNESAKSEDKSEKHTIYSGGESSPEYSAAPGYRPFFVVALFFAVLHLGILVASSDGLNTVVTIYLTGLIMVLAALVLG